jgi:hypothetical protein
MCRHIKPPEYYAENTSSITKILDAVVAGLSGSLLVCVKLFAIGSYELEYLIYCHNVSVHCSHKKLEGSKYVNKSESCLTSGKG